MPPSTGICNEGKNQLFDLFSQPPQLHIHLFSNQYVNSNQSAVNKKYFIFVVLFILSMCRSLNLDAKSLQNSCTLSVEIADKEYNDLTLRVVCHQIGNITISATKSSETKWLFNIPDSVYEKHYYMELHTVDSIPHRICFSIDGNKQSVADFSIGSGKTSIKTHFLSSKKFPKMPVFNNKKVIMDVLNITNPDTNLIASLNLKRAGFDMHGNNREEALSNFLSMTKKYGNTHCCTAVLYSRTNLFKSKDEVHQFYNVLSTEQKESYFGQKIKSFLDLTFFPKIQLPTISDNEPRNIISDSTRYTLVVFQLRGVVLAINRYQFYKRFMMI